ncbi:hypothetical protein FQZ97_959940 [compost metagenome]
MQHQKLGGNAQPATDQNALLIAARKRANRQVQISGVQPHLFHQRGGNGSALLLVDDAKAVAELSEDQCDLVLKDRFIEEKAFCKPVFRHIANATLNGFRRAFNFGLLTFEAD